MIFSVAFIRLLWENTVSAFFFLWFAPFIWMPPSVYYEAKEDQVGVSYHRQYFCLVSFYFLYFCWCSSAH